ncbi:hypothetical protein PAEPH01_0614 [Pancytospora epiphaga]|nr:hypothetical protein PAEPH01_0614 [Pancytospora epiphaga]
MDLSCQQCLLDSHTPTAIIDIFNSLVDATDDLIELIKTTPHQNLKKLRTVFLSVNNYNIEDVVTLSQSSNRQHRYSATYLGLSRIKAECKKRVNFDKIEYLYDNVFAVRFRDVDPLIRGMAVQFVSEFIYDNPILRKTTYLKYIGWALNDRNDSVRRRALRSMAKLTVAYGRMEARRENGEEQENSNNKRRKVLDDDDDFKVFFEKYKDRLVEMACFDSNVNLQKEAGSVVFQLHVAARLFKDEELARVINNDETVTRNKQRVMEVLLPDGVWNMERIHGLYNLLKDKAFANWSLIPSDLEAFVLNILLFIKENSTCCGSSSLCYLNILKMLELPVDPLIFMPLLETTRDNSNNIALVVRCLGRIVSPKEYAGSVTEVLGVLLPIALEDPLVFGPFVELLRKLENDFDVLVADILKQIRLGFKEEYFSFLIKHFDVSDLLCASVSSVDKCYASLWLITRAEYFQIELLQFNDSENLNTLADFLVLFHEQGRIKEDDTIEGLKDRSKVIVDGHTAFIRLYCSLHELISNNLRFYDEESCLHLFKMININLFGDSADLLFRFCNNDTLIQLINMAKYSQPIVTGYLSVVATESKLRVLAKQVASKVRQNEKERYVFKLLRNLVHQKQLLDSVLLFFVPALSANEAIVLESMAIKSKFKSACARLCRLRAPANPEEVETVI